MSPFDKVTFEEEIDDVTYTVGAEVISTYTEDSTEMCVISILGTEEIRRIEQSELTAL